MLPSIDQSPNDSINRPDYGAASRSAKATSDELYIQVEKAPK